MNGSPWSNKYLQINIWKVKVSSLKYFQMIYFFQCSYLQLRQHNCSAWLRLNELNTTMCPLVADIISTNLCTSTPDHRLAMQLLLDCSSIPEVITMVQSHGPEVLHHLFYVSRNWCYSVHRKRMDLLGLYQYR